MKVKKINAVSGLVDEERSGIMVMYVCVCETGKG